jgi:hypothetical protein
MLEPKESRPSPDALWSELEPLSDTVLGHPWAPSFGAADWLARLELVADSDADLTEQKDRALTLYGALGADVLADRLIKACR